MLPCRGVVAACAALALALAGCDFEPPQRDYELLAYRVHPVHLAVGADRVWWAEKPSEDAGLQLHAMQLDDAPIDGLNRQPLAMIAGPLAPYTGSLYAATSDGIGVWPFSGGDPGYLVTLGPTPRDVFVDRDLVYWVTDAPPAVHWMEKTGGLPEHVEIPEGLPERVLADADAVYVMTDDELYRVGKASRELTVLAAASDYGLLLPDSDDSQETSLVARDFVLGEGRLIWMIARGVHHRRRPGPGHRRRPDAPHLVDLRRPRQRRRHPQKGPPAARAGRLVARGPVRPARGRGRLAPAQQSGQALSAHCSNASRTGTPAPWSL